MNYHNYSDYNLFGMKNDTERYLYAGWLMFVVINSLVGDSIILIASIKYNSFKLNKITVVLIQHLAVNDLLNSVCTIAPAMFSAIYNTGSPYRSLDYVRFFISFHTVPVSSLLISALTLSKVLSLKYPLSIRTLSEDKAHKICAALWIFGLHPAIACLLVDKNDVIFDYRGYFCTYLYRSEIWEVLLPIIALIVLFIPNTIVITSTILLLIMAKRAVNVKVITRAVNVRREGLRWQGITTVCLTALTHTISFLPYNSYLVAEPFVEKDPLNPGPFYVEFYRVATAFIIMHVLSNFFVYCLTVASFRNFLLTKLRKIILRRSNCDPYQGENHL